MTPPTVTSLVAATYVRDLDRSRTFYGALGFIEASAGSNDLTAWSSLHHGQHPVLLVTMTPPLELPTFPLLFYFFVADLAAALAALRETGAEAEHMGYPPHATGGEAKILDPDGNTVLLGQPQPSTTQTDEPADDPAQRFSLLREAAAMARRIADPAQACQIGTREGAGCPNPAEVKLADSWGDTAWACLPHADEALIHARVTLGRQDQQRCQEHRHVGLTYAPGRPHIVTLHRTK